MRRWRHLTAPTSTPSPGSQPPARNSFASRERRALTAFAVVTAVAIFVLAASVLLGDQRELRVALSSPSQGESVAVTTKSLSLTFAKEPDHAAVEKNFYIDPPFLGSFRWRGKTAEYVFVKALDIGPVTVTLLPGTLGAGGETLRRAYVLQFQTRAPGFAAVRRGDDGDHLVASTDGGDQRDLLSALQVRDLSVAPDGSELAVVTVAADGQRGLLQIVNPRSGAVTRLVDSPALDIGSATWAADVSALYVVRRDFLPDGSEGVPRVWLMRRSGEFVYALDQSGSPTAAPAPSPDGQSVAYFTPATGELAALKLVGGDAQIVGKPRGGTPAWDPNGQLIAFESVPNIGIASEAIIPLQAVSVRSPDGFIDKTFGRIGEVRSQPRFLDADTVLTLRRVIGPESKGTDLLFESVTSGQLLRAIQLTPQPDTVVSWDLDPTHTHVIYAVTSNNTVVDIEIDLDSGKRTATTPGGLMVQFVP